MFSPAGEQVFRSGDQLYARDRKIVPIGKRKVTFDFTLSTGWKGYDFCRNIHVEAPRGEDSVVMQLRVNEDHLFYEKAMHEARSAAHDKKSATAFIKKLGRELEYPYQSRDAQERLIGGMARVALAHSMRLIALDDSHVMQYLYPAAVNFDSNICQTEEELHSNVKELVIASHRSAQNANV